MRRCKVESPSYTHIVIDLESPPTIKLRKRVAMSALVGKFTMGHSPPQLACGVVNMCGQYLTCAEGTRYTI